MARLDFSLLQSKRCLLTYHSMYNVLFMDLPVSSFVSYLLLLTAKCVDLVVACDGFLCIIEIVCIFIVPTLITEVLFEQCLIRIAV